MRKRAFRLRTVIDDPRRPLVVLTYNLQDIQPWKQRTPRFQTTVYAADGAGLATTLVVAPVDHRDEEQAKQAHAALVASLRKGGAPAELARSA